MKLQISSPNYTTICRRRQDLEVLIPISRSTNARHIFVDSTGLKVYGEGEWEVRQHGYSKRRTWRKLHLAVDESSHEIVAVLMMSHDMGDGELLPDLLDQFDDPLDQLSADGAHDAKECHKAILNRRANATITVPYINYRCYNTQHELSNRT